MDFQEGFDVSMLESSHEIRLVQHGENGQTTKLPFSWILVNLVEHCSNHQSEEPNEDRMTILGHSKIGAALIHAFEEKNASVLKDYIDDLINLKVKANGSHCATLMANYLEKLMMEQKSDTEQQNDEKTEQPIKLMKKKSDSPIKIHSEFKNIKEQFSWFNAITNIYPDLVKDIEGQLESSEYLPLNLIALKTAIDKKLTPKFDEFENDAIRELWARDVYQIQSLVEQMMKGKHCGVDDEKMETLRSNWTRIQILRLFLHHIVPPNMEKLLKKTVLAKIKTVWMTLRNPNMKTHTTFKNVIQVLKIINVQAAKLHYTGGVNECIRCGEIPNKAVALPCGHVGCEDCLI